MKKLSKILLTIILSIFMVSVVHAEDCEDLVLYYKDGLFHDSIKMNVGGYAEGTMFQLQDGNGKVMPAFCHNPSKSFGAVPGGTTYRCRSVVFDTTDPSVTSDLKKAYEAGVMKILVTGYNVNNAGSDVVGYTATDLAIKTFELLWPSNINTNNSNSGNNQNLTNYLKGFQYFANKMIDDKDVSAKIKEATGTLHSKYSGAKQYTWASNGDQIEARAKELVVAGLNASIDYKKNGSTYITYNENPLISRDSTIATNGKNTTYTGSLTYEFKLNKFTSSGAYAKAKFNCKNCASAGITYIVNVNGKEIGKNYTGEIDLLSYVTGGSGTVTFKVDFSGDSNKYSCESLDYTLDVDYYEPTITGTAYEVTSTDYNCSGGNCQGIYVLDNATGKKHFDIEASVSLCGVGCEELKKRCETAGTGSAACAEYKKQFPKGCINCGIGIINNVCADPEKTTDLDLIEGYEIDPETCTQATTANITGCIIENNDAAGNSYVDENLSNGLCTVSCKEDFHFRMPGNIDVDSGRYFSLKTDVTGTKTCYLKLNANRGSIISKFIQGASGTLGLYTNCQYQKALEEAASKVVEKTYSKTFQVGTSSIPGGSKSACLKMGLPISQCVPQKQTITCTGKGYDLEEPIEYETGGCGPGKATLTWHTEPTITLSGGACDVMDGEKPESTGTDSCDALANQTAKPSTVTVPGVGKAYVGSSSYQVGGSADSIYNGIGGLNACALWEMGYDFDPDLYFNYEEAYMKDVLTDKLELIGTISKGSTAKFYCSSNDGDAAYELCGGRSNGWSTSPIFASEKVCVCNGDGCELESIAVNATVRMKESISFSASYITPTQFYTIYPSGAIVAAKSASGIANASELTNALPVGLGTPQGVHHYALYAKNLGEYFTTGKFGRVWGNKNSVVAATLKSADKCIRDGALRFDTDINGTYIGNGVWVCDYCVNGNCENDCNDYVCNERECTLKDGSKTITKEEYKKECPNLKCEKVLKDGKTTYYGPTGDIITEAEYNSKCCPDCPLGFECALVEGKYYGKTGNVVNKEQFEKECDNCPDCPPTCETCIYNDGVNFIFRSVSTGDLNPNNRKLGANWRYDDKQIKTALEMKAYATTEEIVADGETIYDESTNKYVMKVKMDSAMINTIKNRKEKDYAANTLECYSYTENGKTYNNIFCYSKYLDELLENSKLKNKIEFSVARPSTKAERKNSQNSEYWTTWTKTLANSKWNITTSKELSYYHSNYGEIGIGPSWK